MPWQLFLLVPFRIQFCWLWYSFVMWSLLRNSDGQISVVCLNKQVEVMHLFWKMLLTCWLKALYWRYIIGMFTFSYHQSAKLEEVCQAATTYMVFYMHTIVYFLILAMPGTQASYFDSLSKKHQDYFYACLMHLSACGACWILPQLLITKKQKQKHSKWWKSNVDGIGCQKLAVAWNTWKNSEGSISAVSWEQTARS